MSQNNTAGELIKVVEAHVNAERQKIASAFHEFDIEAEKYLIEGKSYADSVQDICSEFEFYGTDDVKCPLSEVHEVNDTTSTYAARQVHPKIFYGKLRSDSPHSAWIVGWEINSSEDYFASDYNILKVVGYKESGRTSAYNMAKHLCHKAKEANSKLDELNQLLEYTKRITQHEQH